MNVKSQVLVFILTTLLISWSYEAFVIFHGGVKSFGLPGLILLMWVPGLVSILFRLKYGFKDIGFRLGQGKFYIYAVGLPLLLALATLRAEN
jgi:hypothetical protein